MAKSQFNIKISKDLLTKIKRQAITSGKTLTEHITDLIEKSLSEDMDDLRNNSLEEQISAIEERLLSIESKVTNRQS